MSQFCMPSLGADMESGTLVEWLKQPGDRLAPGDIIAVVETDKGAIEIEVFERGTLTEQLLQPGATVPVGTPMAMIDGGAPPVAAPRPAARPAQAPPAAVPAAAPAAAAPAPVAAETGGGRLRVSPAARRLAAERGVALERLHGSGPDGAVVSADVLAAASAAPPTPTQPAPAPSRGLDMAAMRRAIGAAMARSMREIPHYYLSHRVEVGAAEAWLAATNAQRQPADRLLMGTLFVKAAALALKKYPEFNGTYEDGTFRPAAAVHLGLAIAVRGGGLIAPAIHGADGRDLNDLMAGMRDLVARARSGGLRSSELSDGTATLSSLGDRGVDLLYGVIYPPQVALIGVGKVARRPWVVDDAVVPRPVVAWTLAADHRVSDGHRGALLLAEIERLLQQPEAL
ncbi:MAG: dihydrolipoamide acetyltransferase family protein [Alphaproteobacteria bacterium]